MADTYVQLPNGQYVQVPEGATPDQLQQFKTKLVQMANKPNLVTGAGMEARAMQQAHRLFTGTGDQGSYDATGKKIAGPNGEPLTLLEKAAQEQSDRQTLLATRMQHAAQSPTPVTMATAAYAPVAAAKAIAGAKIGGTAARKTAEALGAGETGQNLAEVGGSVLGVAGAFKGPSLVKWLASSKSAGAQALQAASAKAGNAPIELSPQTNEIVDKLVESSKLGGKPVKVVSDLLERLGPSTKQAADAVPGPLTYDEARILQSNISQLSAEEAAGLKGSQKGLMKQLAASFSKDVQNGADAAGIGPEHAIGMRGYAAASARNRALATAGKAVPYVGGAGYGIHLIQDLLKKGKQ